MFVKKKIDFIIMLFVILSIKSYSREFLSSNGENFLIFNSERSRVEKIDLDLKNKSYDIEFVKLGFFINGQQYEIGENEYEVVCLPGSNIVEIKGEFGDLKYKISLYSSILNKNAIVFNTELLSYKKNDLVSTYVYIKPKEIGILNVEGDTVRYSDAYFAGEKTKAYVVNDTESKAKILKNIEKDTYAAKNQGIFIINQMDLSKSNEIKFSIQKNGVYKNTVLNEKNEWIELLKNYQNKELYSNLLMLKNKSIIVDITGEIPVINIEQTLKYIELTLIKKDYLETKKTLEYLLGNIDENIEGIIPSDYLDLNGKIIYKKDNYGIYNSYYRRAIFLKLYLTYLRESGDKEFYIRTFPKVKTKLIDWLETEVGEKGVEPDSGNSRIGADGSKRFVETQYEIYKSFKQLYEFMLANNIKEEKYKKISESLKEIMILYYVDGINISDYPFSKELNPKNIFYIDEDLFISNSDYNNALQKNIDLLKKGKSNLKENINFVNYLYDKKYYIMADFLKEEIEKELKGEKGIELLQKDLSLLINYLIMKEKGEKYGFDK